MANPSFLTLLLAAVIAQAFFCSYTGANALQGMNLAAPVVRRAEHAELNERMLKKRRPQNNNNNNNVVDDVPVNPAGDVTPSGSTTTATSNTTPPPIQTTSSPRPTTSTAQSSVRIYLTFSRSFYSLVLSSPPPKASSIRPLRSFPYPRPQQVASRLPHRAPCRRPPLRLLPPLSLSLYQPSLLSHLPQTRQVAPFTLLHQPQTLRRLQTPLKTSPPPSCQSLSLSVSLSPAPVSLLVLPSGPSSASGSSAPLATLRIVSSLSTGSPPKILVSVTIPLSPPLHVLDREMALDHPPTCQKIMTAYEI